MIVAVATFRRRADLAELLPMLRSQAREVSAADPGAAASVLVVDNDAHGSARGVVGPGEDDVRYVIEARAGIAAARNRALEESAAADLLVFIDDDERPAEGWLARLLDAWRLYGAAAITGPVTSIVDGPLDPWLAAGGIFDRWHRTTTPTGSRLASAATNNLLLDLGRVRAHRLRFVDELGLSGGEDTLFTSQLVRLGERIVWCADAEVVESVRPERVSRRWMMMRAFSYGTIDCRVAVALAPKRTRRFAARLRCTGHGVARVGYGASRAALGFGTGAKRHQALGSQTLMRGLGLLLGSLGYTYRRYRVSRE